MSRRVYTVRRAALCTLYTAALLLAARVLAEPPAAAKVWITSLSGTVDQGSGAHLIDAIRQAEEQGALALVIRIDTPGGFLDTTRSVVQAELSSKVPVVAWVGPPGARAGSAGVFLTMAANVAAMAPSTNIGAAHPVSLGGSNKRPKGAEKDDQGHEAPPAADEDVMARKVENDTVAFVTGLAERRGRNVGWAEQAVRESVSVTASKALELKVIDLIAEDLPELLQKLEGRTVELGAGNKVTLHTAGAATWELPVSLRHRVLHFLADPELAYLLGMLGLLGLLFEFYHPGGIVPGVMGVVCLLTAAGAFQMLPVNASAAALILVGMGFLAAEMYAGGHGAFIVAGGLCIVVGSLLLVGGGSASGFWGDRDLRIGWQTVAPVGLSISVIAYTLVSKVAGTRKNALRGGADVLLGQIGEVREPLSGSGEVDGQVLVNGELWRARSRSAIPAGAKARVVAVEGLTVLVAPIAATEEPQAAT